MFCAPRTPRPTSIPSSSRISRSAMFFPREEELLRPEWQPSTLASPSRPLSTPSTDNAHQVSPPLTKLPTKSAQDRLTSVSVRKRHVYHLLFLILVQMLLSSLAQLP